MLGAPAFPKITVTLPGDHPLVITAVATSCDPPVDCSGSTNAGGPRSCAAVGASGAGKMSSSADNRYVQKLMFNGATYDKNYLKLDDLRAGGTLAFEMSSTPNTSRGTSPAAAPSSW